jgi:hypothetical protein
MTTTCPGCFPQFQENQLAHAEPGGCLWCDNEVTNEDFDFDSFLQDENKKDPEIESSVTGNSEKVAVECCICYETINKDKNNCVTDCGHAFCLKCLVTSFAHGNNACPCCRTEVIDMPEEEDEEEDDEEEDDYTEVDSENGSAVDIEYPYDEDECDIEELSRRLQSNGINMNDILSMLIGRYAKGTQHEGAEEISDKFDKIVLDADNEKIEQNLFAAEDVRV